MVDLMIRICNNLYVGEENDCFYDVRDDWVVIHACKSPCHQRAVGYKGNLPKVHPNYLIFEQRAHLFLNMIDMDIPLDHKYMDPIINTAMKFIENNISTKNVLIHCNQGISRSPTLALIYLAKKVKTFNNQTYEMVKIEFMKTYPGYQPGHGLEYYLDHHWDNICK